MYASGTRCVCGMDTCDRGACAGYDFTQLTLVQDGSWHEMDLSSIVPEGALFVKLHCGIRSPNADDSMKLRKAGTARVFNIYALHVNVVSQTIKGDAWIPLSIDRKVEYSFTNRIWDVITIVVGGWQIAA